MDLFVLTQILFIITDLSFQTIESFAAQEKQMEVCEVCGAFLIVGDAQSRVDDHLMGKQHMGYAKIKATVEELKVSFQACTLATASTVLQCGYKLIT